MNTFYYTSEVDGNYCLRLLMINMAKKRRTEIKGYLGLIRAIEMEDGSGHNYNIKMLVDGKTISVFVKVSLTDI